MTTPASSKNAITRPAASVTCADSLIRIGSKSGLLAGVMTGFLTLAATPAMANYPYGSQTGSQTGSQIERAEVLSVSPVVETVEVYQPREVCRNEQVRLNTRGYRDGYSRGYRSRTPGVVGAIVGGALGHAVGNGKTNKKIGTAVGAVLGGSIGADISRRNHERRDYGHSGVRYRTERVCEVVSDTRTEERIRGYDVAYAYGGATYTTLLDYDPGRYLDVSVSVTPVP